MRPADLIDALPGDRRERLHRIASGRGEAPEDVLIALIDIGLDKEEMHLCASTRIHVAITPGAAPNVRVVQFQVDDETIVLVVDREHLNELEETMRVYVLRDVHGNLLVQFPARLGEPRQAQWLPRNSVLGLA